MLGITPYTVLSLYTLWQFFFFSAVVSYGDVRIAPFFLGSAAEVIMSSVYRTSSTFTLYEVVAVFRFDLVTADVATDRIY